MSLGLVIFMIAWAAFVVFSVVYGADTRDGRDWLKDPYAL